MKEFLDAFKRYADFEGRSTRKEFWMFVLVYLIISVALNILHLGMVHGLFILVSLIPGISVTVRRLRDASFNVWWILLSLIPFVGGIILAIMCIKPTVVVSVTSAPENNETPIQ